MKRNNTKERLKRMREGDRRDSLKEEGNVHLPPNKVHTPKPKKEKHAPKRFRFVPDDCEEITNRVTVKNIRSFVQKSYNFKTWGIIP